VITNLLLMGRPGIGKTTIIRRVAEALGDRAGGFYTEEVREHGRRVGFRIVTLTGEVAWLARVGLRSPYRVGRYGVDVVGLEKVGVASLRQALETKDVIIVDEIGRMELYAPAFRHVVSAALDSPKPLVGTIMAKRHPWADTVKARDDVELWEVTEHNRDGLPDRILEWLKMRGCPPEKRHRPSEL